MANKRQNRKKSASPASAVKNEPQVCGEARKDAAVPGAAELTEREKTTFAQPEERPSEASAQESAAGGARAENAEEESAAVREKAESSAPGEAAVPESAGAPPDEKLPALLELPAEPETPEPADRQEPPAEPEQPDVPELPAEPVSLEPAAAELKEKEAVKQPKGAKRPGRHSFAYYFFLFTLVVLAGSAGTVVFLFQSTGTSLFTTRPDVDLPNFFNMSREEIEGSEQYEKFRIEYEEEYNDEVGVGVVFDQRPKAPKQVKENAHITLVVSRGVEMVNVPDVAGWARATAREKLKDVGLSILIKREESGTVPTGSVIRTVPSAGVSIKAGTTVTVYISRPKEDYAASVPSCVGLSQTDALRLISARKLSPNVITEDSDSPKGYVLSQSPAAGTILDKGGRVTLRVSSGQAPNTDPSGHVHDWSIPDADGWRFCYVCLERQHVANWPTS